MLRTKWLCASTVALVLLAQGCATTPFRGVYIGETSGDRPRATFSQGETIRIDLTENTYGSWQQDYLRPAPPGYRWTEFVVTGGPALSFTVYLRDVLKNREMRLGGGSTEGMGMGWTIYIEPTSRRPDISQGDGSWSSYYTSTKHVDLPPGSYLVIVRWRKSLAEWEKRNEMTLPFKVK